MIHTATLTYSPTKELFQSFIHASGVRYDPKRKQFMKDSFKSHGIVLFAFAVQNKTFYSYSFICRINFKRLIEIEDRIATFTESDLNAVAASFDALMAKVSPDMPLFFDWKVNRIDYCVNVRTPNVAEYIRLLQKSDMPHYVHLPYNKHRNYAYQKGSLYLVGKSITVNIYDKQDQLRNEQKINTDITDSMVEQAQDILRIEVQCHSSRTNYLKFKYDMETKTIGYFLSDEISTQVLLATLDRITRHADFQRRNIALQWIDLSPYSQRKKKQLQQLITDVARQYQSIWKVRDKYESEGKMTRNTFNQYLRVLESMNINAITLSDNRNLEGQSLTTGLPNLQDLLLDAIANEIYVDALELEDEN